MCFSGFLFPFVLLKSDYKQQVNSRKISIFESDCLTMRDMTLFSIKKKKFKPKPSRTEDRFLCSYKGYSIICIGRQERKSNLRTRTELNSGSHSCVALYNNYFLIYALNGFKYSTILK